MFDSPDGCFPSDRWKATVKRLSKVLGNQPLSELSFSQWQFVSYYIDGKRPLGCFPKCLEINHFLHERSLCGILFLTMLMESGYQEAFKSAWKSTTFSTVVSSVIICFSLYDRNRPSEAFQSAWKSTTFYTDIFSVTVCFLLYWRKAVVRRLSKITGYQPLSARSCYLWQFFLSILKINGY